jgi:hypothetical protein
VRMTSDGVVDFGEREVALSCLAPVGEETFCFFPVARVWPRQMNREQITFRSTGGIPL